MLIKVLMVLLFSSSMLLGANGIVSISLGAFFSGILLTFTPCVLPMVPIVSSIIAGQGKEVTQRKAVMLSLSYVMGTALTYTLMGALAGATGEQLQSYFQNIWAISAMSLIFVVMALSMFGLFTIALPSFIQSKINASSQGIKGGNMLMVFVLGMISALVLGACVSPVLISFLSVAISSSDAMLGAMTMFALALGMGVPLILLGFGAGYLLPKAGMWMDKVKYFFGVLLLGVAIEIFSNLELVNVLFLWGAYLVGIAVYLGATQALDKDSSGWYKLQKSLGTILLIWGTLLLIGAGYGGYNIWQPLPKQTHTVLEGDDKMVLSGALPFEDLKSIYAYEKKRKEAMAEGKPMILFFHTDTCPVCKHLRETTFQDAKVQKTLKENYKAYAVNISDKSNEAIAVLKKKFNIFGPPSFVFIDAEGEVLDSDTFYGYQNALDFYDTLDLIAE